MLGLIDDFEVKNGTNMKYARCNNAEENENFERVCKQEGTGLQLEYTALGTPQLNCHVGQKFATLFNRVHDMVNHGKFSSFMRNSLLAGAANTATPEKQSTHPHERFQPISTFFGKRK